MSNKYAGPCVRCGRNVPAGAGVVETRRDADAMTVSHVVAHTTCPDQSESQGANPIGEVVPRWAVYSDGITRDGNESHGVRFVEGDPPHFSAVAMNEPARRIAAQWPKPREVASAEYRAQILARFGHDESSFADLHALRTEYRRVVPGDFRRAHPEPMASELSDAIAKWEPSE